MDAIATLIFYVAEAITIIAFGIGLCMIFAKALYTLYKKLELNKIIDSTFED